MSDANFNDALVKLAAKIAGMVGYIEEQIVITMEGFTENNPAKCDTAIEYTKSVQKLQNESFQNIIYLLVKFQPKGYDAKLVMSSWRIASSLERITFLMRDIAIQVKEIDHAHVSFAKSALQNMCDSLLAQTYDIVVAYTTDNKEVLPQIRQKEQYISSIYKSFFKEAFTFLNQNQDIINQGEMILSLTKNLEITGRYMKEIADQLEYKNLSENK